MENKGALRKIRVANWNNKEFFALLRGLSEIPPQLYILSAREKANGQSINFAVAELPDNLAKIEGHIPLKECYCNKSATKPRVILVKRVGMSDERRTGHAHVIIHDLVHRRTDESLDTLDKALFRALGIKSFKSLQERFRTAKGDSQIRASI